MPIGNENRVFGSNPPLNVSGMTLTIVDASGRLSEFVAVPQPREDGTPPVPADWNVLFDAAGIDMAAFKPVAPQMVPPVFADERLAWEGQLPELPDHTFQVEAAGYKGKPVYFFVGGPWSRSARSAPAAIPLFNVLIASMTALVMPGLMVAGAVLARRNVKLGRGDRRGAFRAASFIFVAEMVVWVLNDHVLPLGVDVQRGFAAMGTALFDGAVLWLTYLGLEPYIRRYSPDSLIGWTRLLAGRWRDPRVGADIMIGVSAGLAMTLLYAVHNIIPPLLGQPEPMPLQVPGNALLGTREALAVLIARLANALLSAMLGVVGIVALLIWLKRAWLAAIAGILVFTPVVLTGLFRPGTPVLDLIIGAGIITIFIVTIIRFGLLATMGALATHFVLLRAPLTVELSSWRGSIALLFLSFVAIAGFGAVYIARRGRSPSPIHP